MALIAFIDTEVRNGKIVDYGAVIDDVELHTSSGNEFKNFIKESVYVCGHNIVGFDLEYLNQNCNVYDPSKAIDTLFLSPLLFPQWPYHRLDKDEKIIEGEWNNPLIDAKKARERFYDEIEAFKFLPEKIQQIYTALLSNIDGFSAFFKFLNVIPNSVTADDIKSVFKGKICEQADISKFMEESPVELAYALALIGIENHKKESITPEWVLYTFPKIEIIIHTLCNVSCYQCEYCQSHFDIHRQLKRYFGFDDFKKYEDEPLQEKACQAAVDNKSLIAIFPTGGGKSLTFQLPALIAGENIRGLTVVISPLQSLMKDQIDHLNSKGIVDAVAINGLLNPLDRAKAIECVKSGLATILYISPEQLRSKTIEKILFMRNIVRFVIDEAHCFSAWGQDFRVDYLFIGKFIKHLQEKKGNQNPIAISCFTATAKQKVISDIKSYFKDELDLDLEVYSSSATRKNLKYFVEKVQNDEEKYEKLRSLIEQKNCSTIVYVQSVAKTYKIAERLINDGIYALPYNGKMDPDEKIKNQEDFLRNDVKVMVATSAFGMGVDKSDIGLIIHFTVPSSLEDYIQEAGRGARDEHLNADCYILFAENDIDANFMMLNQNKITLHEIQLVWQAIKRLTKNHCCRSALEIADLAGWKNTDEVETRIKTALQALEEAKFIVRGENVPRVFATSISVNSTIEAEKIMDVSHLFTEQQKSLANSVISKLIGKKRRSMAHNAEADARVDYLADFLGVEKEKIIEVIDLMKQAKILADFHDMTAKIPEGDLQKKVESAFLLEMSFLKELKFEKNLLSLKELNKKFQDQGQKCQVKSLQKIINFKIIQSVFEKTKGGMEGKIDINLCKDQKEIWREFNLRYKICQFIIPHLLQRFHLGEEREKAERRVSFSAVELLNAYQNKKTFDFFEDGKITIKDIENALLYLHKMDIITLEGGFLVSYNSMKLTRLVLDNHRQYKKADYDFLEDYYKQKIQQIHMVGFLLNMFVESYQKALEYIKDYFGLKYKEFIAKYFKGNNKELEINMTPAYYNKLFGQLSNKQKEIINDDKSKYIVVAAGPGSGKTKVLVHKLASLLIKEDTKPEQLLMLTFSRAATIEFKKRLRGLIKGKVEYVDIKTFHSFCFDLLGRPGNIEENTDLVVQETIRLIKNREFEPLKLAKTVLVLDEAQDMSEHEFHLVEAILEYNESMRLIAVGDDDQNVYEFRGSDSKYFQSLVEKYGAIKYELLENYRSRQEIVDISNSFIQGIQNRLKKNLCFTSKKEGTVEFNKYVSKNFEKPLIDDILNHNLVGTTAVLTNTNEGALQILSQLVQRGIKAKLIQSLDGFRLYDLLEIRVFINYLKLSNQGVKITIEAWYKAFENLKKNFEKSSIFSQVEKMLDSFKEVYTRKKEDEEYSFMYFSDLEEFFYEAKFENFYDEEKETITVSTLHKAKGHEYNNVYLALQDYSYYQDKDKRTLYVGMTRAKDFLSFHFNNDCLFKFAQCNNFEVRQNNICYDETKEITIQLGYKDINLGRFEFHQCNVKKLRSGMELKICEDGLVDENMKEILKYSKEFKKHLTQDYLSKGFEIKQAKVRFMVYWKNKNNEKESIIVLPELTLVREQKLNQSGINCGF